MPTTDTHRILILGAYGFFGSRIATGLARNKRIHLILAGRNLQKATALAYQIGLRAENARAIDATDPQFTLWLRKLGVNTLIHTAGPFQDQSYSVANACIQAGCNYLDLSDGRAFVCGIVKLDAAARAAAVSVVSGVSSLPAFTAAVVDRYLHDFARLDVIRIGISSGAVVPGIATLKAVFGYCGKPFRVLEKGQWQIVHGWLDTQQHEFPKPVGPRTLGRCDVPDHDLLPLRYPTVKTVSFHAGFASNTAHRVVERLAMWVRDGKLRSAVPFARALNTIARWIRPMVSDRGAMFVRMEGMHENGAPLTLTWNLVTRENHGPNVPCAAAIALANKIAAGDKLPTGAMPCLGLLNVDDLMEPLKGLSIRELQPPSVSGVSR